MADAKPGGTPAGPGGIPAPKPADKTESKAPTAMSTYNSMSGDPLLRDPRGDTFLTHDEIKSLAGDIKPGQLALLKLDDEGKPSGSIVRNILEARHNPDDFYTTVISPANIRPDEIVTPSGAPVSKFMNPDPVLWDAGMLARNPPPPPSKDEGPPLIGGGVINQPVRV